MFAINADFSFEFPSASSNGYGLSATYLIPVPTLVDPYAGGSGGAEVTADLGSVVTTGGQTYKLSSLYTVSASGDSHPAYLVLTALDRNEYAAGSTGATGWISGNGVKDSLTGSSNSDARTAGIVFTYDSATGRYYNSTYGYFDQVTYTSSNSASDVTDLAVYTTDSGTLAHACATSTTAMDALSYGNVAGTTYCGTVTLATDSAHSGSTPSQATPSSIVSTAESYIGKSWNMDGCWVLASTISAEAGASLPVTSSDVGTPGMASGEWMVAYNGPVSASADWESQLKAGEFVVFKTASGGGHITCVVSGSGSSAQLVDNITYEDANGKVLNSAHDGNSQDIVISSPHAASQEFNGVDPRSVVIYELDTPTVTPLASSVTMGCRATKRLDGLFTATDPAKKPITLYQIYNTSGADSLVVSGVTKSAHSASSAIQATSLSDVSLIAGDVPGSDTLEVRAYNGSYWGDWNSVSVDVTGSSVSTVGHSTAHAQHDLLV